MHVIISIRHKGLRLYYEEANKGKLPATQIPRIRRILDALDAIASENDILSLGHGIHQLKGQYAGFWSLSVSGNYRVIFRFEAGDVHDVDYVDYH